MNVMQAIDAMIGGPDTQPEPMPADGRFDQGDRLLAAGRVHDLGNLIQLAASALAIMSRSPALESGLAALVVSARSSLDRAALLVTHALREDRVFASPGQTARIAECLGEVRAAMRGDRRSGIHLDIRCEPGLPDLACDALGLHCAVLNLVLNAREAMGGRGVIRLRARSCGGTSPHMAEIRITDSGIGMSAEAIAKAFDPSFTTRTGVPGGIGLPMVRRFAEDSGGEVFIESRPGTGTNVILRLPLAAAAAAYARSVHVQPAAPLHRETQP